MIIGPDNLQHCRTFNTTAQKYIEFPRPQDTSPWFLHSYFIPDNIRLHGKVAPQPLSEAHSLLNNIHYVSQRVPLKFCKRLHRYTHAPAAEPKIIFAEAGILNEENDRKISRISEACEICATAGRLLHARKVSLTHVNEEFNEEVQMDLLYCSVRDIRVMLINMNDAGTGYAEVFIIKNRKSSTITTCIEIGWINRHGAPRSMSADDEYNTNPIRTFLASHDISSKPRPARRHNRAGIVERGNGTLNTILAKIEKEIGDASIESLIQKCAFY